MRCLHRHHNTRGWLARWMMRRLGRKLNLDTTQKAKLEQLQEKMQEVREELRQVRRESREEMERLLAADKLDREAAARLMAVPRHALAERAPEVVDGFADFFDKLDSSQRSKLLKLWRRHQHHHGIHA